MTSHSSRYDVAIVGAGPAGLSAAEQIVRQGGQVIILDEQPRPGGQVMRQPPKEFIVRNWLKGSLYTALKDLLHRMEDHPKVTWKLSTTVSGIMPQDENDPRQGYHLWIMDSQGQHCIAAKKVLICSGCYERPIAFPGSTKPGVMGAGAIQTFLKSQQIIAGNSFVFAGAHPLQLIVAEQIIEAGGKVAAIAFTQSPYSLLSLLKSPLILLTHWRTFMAAAKSLWRLKKASVPILFGYAIKEAKGTDILSSVIVQPVTPSGQPTDDRPLRTFSADRLGLCYGFQVSSELARQAGAKSRWSATQGGWVIPHSSWMESDLSGLYVAGEITGMAGAEASRHEGAIAGVGISLSLGLIPQEQADRVAPKFRKRLHHSNRFAQTLNHISRLTPNLMATISTDDSLICRCEMITCGTLKEAMAENPHLREANSIKLLTRAGMGLCQGRLCYANIAALIAHFHNCPIEDIGPFHANWPVRPVPLNSLIDQNNTR